METPIGLLVCLCIRTANVESSSPILKTNGLAAQGQGGSFVGLQSSAYLVQGIGILCEIRRRGLNNRLFLLKAALWKSIE
jgi:hypothetical protein